MNLASWQAGLVLGAVFSIGLDFLIRFLIHRYAWHRHHRKCAYCDGVIEPDGTAFGAVPKLVYCEICLDTVPGHVANPDKHYLPIEHYFEDQKQRRETLQ